MKKKRPFILLLSILLTLFLFPIAAMAEEADGTVVPAETNVAMVVENDSASVLKAVVPEVATLEEPAKNEAAPTVAGNEAVQEQKALAPDGEDAINKEEADQPIKLIDVELTLTTTEGEVGSVPANPAATISDEDYPEMTDPDVYVFDDDPAEYVVKVDETALFVSGKNIALEDGTYNYKFYANEAGRLLFDNDLDILYQEVYGKYNLHYDMVDTDNHMMIANGKFDNILAASPLLKRQSARISNDTYAYQLNLRTEEGFSYNNSLNYLYDGNQRASSVSFNYDKVSKSQTVVINGLSGHTLTLNSRLLQI